MTDKNGQPLDPPRHGLNRDAVRVALIGSQIGVIAVADGCGLTYWSEIAANIATNEFICYMEKNLPKEPPPYAPSAIKQLMRSAIQSVNQTMLTWKHPKTKAKCNVLDKGGNTTLVVALVFPFMEDEVTTFKNPGEHSTPSSSIPTPSSSVGEIRSSSSLPAPTIHHSPDSPNKHEERSKPTRKVSHIEPEPLRYGVVFTGMGDSEIYLYKTMEPELPQKEKRHQQAHHQSQHSLSASTLPPPDKSSSFNHINDDISSDPSKNDTKYDANKPKNVKKDKQSIKFGTLFTSFPRPHSRKPTNATSNPAADPSSSSSTTAQATTTTTSSFSATVKFDEEILVEGIAD